MEVLSCCCLQRESGSLLPVILLNSPAALCLTSAVWPFLRDFFILSLRLCGFSPGTLYSDFLPPSRDVPVAFFVMLRWPVLCARPLCAGGVESEPGTGHTGHTGEESQFHPALSTGLHPGGTSPTSHLLLHTVELLSLVCTVDGWTFH